MKAMDRHRARVEALVSEPLDGEEDIVYGEASDEVKTYLPLAANLISEVTSTQLKKKEQEEAKKKLESGEAFKATKAAQAARQKAEMAKADAIPEADPNGPKHRTAAQYELEARAAEQKAMYFAQQAYAAGPGAGAGQMVPYGQPSGASTLLTPRNMLIAGGVVLGLGVVVMLARK